VGSAVEVLGAGELVLVTRNLGAFTKLCESVNRTVLCGCLKRNKYLKTQIGERSQIGAIVLQVI